MTTTLAPAETFRALGDPVRCAIVEHLAGRDDATIGELAALFPISMQAVSKHVKVLEGAGLLTQRRSGRHRPVQLVRSEMDGALGWIERLLRDPGARLDRLDDLLADLRTIPADPSPADASPADPSPTDSSPTEGTPT